MTACGSSWIESQKGQVCFEKINWVTNRVHHENRPHSSSKIESFSGSRLLSIDSKYSSVILPLKVYFISPHKLLFGCIFGPRLNSQAICPVLRNIDGYAFTHSMPWYSGESLPRRPLATKRSEKHWFQIDNLPQSVTSHMQRHVCDFHVLCSHEATV